MYGMGGYGGGYGGASSYGGLGSYGSTYGSSYGTGSTGYNSSGRYGSTTPTRTADGKVEGEKEVDPNNPNVPAEEKKKQEELSHRKIIFEEWFKMMGGLRSIVELGFAVIALASFCSKSAQIFQKFLQFGKQASKSLGNFIESKIPTKIFTNLATPEKRGKAIKSIVMMVIRIFAALLFCLGVKLRKDIKQQAQMRKQQMQKELELIKQQELELVEQVQGENQQCERETLQQANL